MIYFDMNLSKETDIKTFVGSLLKEENSLDIITDLLIDETLDDEIKFNISIEYALKIKDIDLSRCASYINNAIYFLNKYNSTIYKNQLETLLNLTYELKIDSIDIFMLYNNHFGNFPTKINEKIYSEYTILKEIKNNKNAHGHVLIIDYIKNHFSDLGNEKIFIEIGTTRENVSNQGSTFEIAKLCKNKNLKFITVDMDKNNTKWALFVGKIIGYNFQAYTMKGENFLQNEIEEFDFIFLDAYDFYHDNHSTIRQKIYKNNLGSEINNNGCYQMHLDCAKSIVKKLRKNGVICIDDAWRNENNEWVAKGTLAIPYLLENGFEIIQERNRAVLLKRKQ